MTLEKIKNSSAEINGFVTIEYLVKKAKKDFENGNIQNYRKSLNQIIDISKLLDDKETFHEFIKKVHAPYVPIATQ